MENPFVSRTRWVRLVTKLLELTQRGKIHWTVVSNNEHLPADERASVFYEASFLDKNLRLYEYQHKFWLDEDRWEWGSGIKLEITDPLGRPLYAVPGVEGLSDLLDAVKYETADLDNFLDKVAALPDA